MLRPSLENTRNASSNSEGEQQANDGMVALHGLVAGTFLVQAHWRRQLLRLGCGLCVREQRVLSPNAQVGQHTLSNIFTAYTYHR